MKMRMKQRFLTWFDSYDIYDEDGQVCFTVKGELAWGHQLRIYDAAGCPVGMVKQRVLVFLPRFDLYEDDVKTGEVCRELSLFVPRYSLDWGWTVSGDFFGWDYSITKEDGQEVARLSKVLWQWTDTYEMDVADPADALHVLMVALSIDDANCSDGR